MAAQRRTHRKRISALRLSSDTTSTLPEYIGWRDVVPPPEYEADEDTDDNDGDSEQPYVPPTPMSPRLHARRTTHRRKTSSPLPQDAFLDSLLERSVHALELSNALLQSSMTPTSSAFREPSPTAPVAMPPPREPWVADLAAIERDVDELLVSSSLPSTVSTPPHRRPRRRPSLDPTSSSSYFSSQSYSSSGGGLRIAPAPRARLVSPAPRALTQFVGSSSSGADDASIALPSTLGLRAPPSDWRGVGLPAGPALSARAPEPSTPAYTMLSAFVHPGPASPPPHGRMSRSSSRGRARTPTPPVAGVVEGLGRGRTGTPPVPVRPMTPPVEQPSPTPSPPSLSPQPHARETTPRPPTSTPRLTAHPSGSFTAHPNGSASRLTSHPNGMTAHPNGSTFTSHPNASTISHTLPASASHSPQSSEAGDAEGGECRAKAARSALRMILDKAPPPPKPRRPQFQPYTPPPAAHTAASTATASVSRLFAKNGGGRHSVSTAPPVGRGIMKVGGSAGHSPHPSMSANANAEASGSGAGTGAGGSGSGSGGGGKEEGTARTPTTPSYGQSAFWARATGSRGTSGASTPKRISFAELPESWASSRPAGAGSAASRAKSRSKAKSKARKGKGKAGDGRGGEGKGGGGGGGEEGEGGWLAWLVGVSSGSSLSASNSYGGGMGGGMEERERERERRGSGVWGGGMGAFGGGWGDGEGGGG
ncbi:hypothetical protein FB451DRAFT_1371119 [Mycena latifolia]|nr:hypothetical protein FB451DRAFT_1371119 [Mycena latifolia]